MLESLKDWVAGMSTMAKGVTALIAIASFVLGTVRFCYPYYEQYTEVVAFVQQYRQEVSPKLDEIIGKLDRMDQRAMVISGLAVVLSSGQDDAYVKINEVSRADVYLREERVKVTNLSRSIRPSDIFKIAGSFSSEDMDVRIALSRKAADRLEVGDENRIMVRLEPAPR